MTDLDEIVKEFLMESYENLDQLDRDFVALETDPTATDKLKSIFRTIHTIKGTCGCLGYKKLEAVAHVGENLLSRLREGQLLMDKDIASALLKMVDAVREILATLETTGGEGDRDYSDVRQTLITLNERPSIDGTTPNSQPAHTPASAASAVEQTPSLSPIQPHIEPQTQPPIQPPIQLPVQPMPPQPAAEAVPEPAHESTAPAAGDGASKESLAGNAIRVDVNLLDRLMNLVGELVLARNQVLQFTAGPQGTALVRTAQRLNLITTELQEGVMKTRMQPIGNLWNKFPRIVRDVASNCGKKVRIEMEGRDTELDKTIIEAIKDPLTHVIRNSVDHGVESPEQRIKAGKPEEGRLFMRAFHEGGQVNIEISDDGKGINSEIIKRKAVEKGLITADQAARMGEREATNLIFLPGFSTAEKITNVSGRGVGMDVVKTNVERIGGTVDVTSKVGEGTILRIRIPLTLAIIPALVVTSGGHRFAIPQVSLLELVRVEENDPGIESINDTAVYRLRGNLLPLVYLNREFKLTTPVVTDVTQIDNATNIVVLRGGERQFGLVVDQINDAEEIVVKPLGKQLKSLTTFAGATIMGDGKVALILDVLGLAQRAHVVVHGSENAAAIAEIEKARADGTIDQTLLVCNLLGGQRSAIPLSLVARLEEFSPSLIEESGEGPVVQYRGEIMPLINVADVLRRIGRRRINRVRKEKLQEPVQVVVYTHENRNVGLRVESILEVVHDQTVVQPTASRPCVLGTAVIREKVTELLDVALIVRSALSHQEIPERLAA